MELSCTHCGQPFTVTAEQLGGRGRCPHCQGSIRLPKLGSQPTGPVELIREPSHFFENSVSALVSLVVHMALLLLLALISYDAYSGEGMGEDVLIGDIPSVVLSNTASQELEAPSLATDLEPLTEQLEEVVPPTETDPEGTTEPLLVDVAPSLSSGEVSSFNMGSLTAGGGGMSGGSWEGLLQNLRRNGLDIVICFDSTGSMSGEIRQVKEQIRRIGETLLTMVPKARISLCTYRDRPDAYVVRGIPLTGELSLIEEFLGSVRAAGGGDEPEAVLDGLKWAVSENQFRPPARKIILLFGDAPPHRQDLNACLAVASDFAAQQRGVVSTVTCRSPHALPEFVAIAQAGGGEAFLTADEREIMTQLMVLVFGSRHRSKVIEAFRLMER